jgi:hypothetical protein
LRRGAPQAQRTDQVRMSAGRFTQDDLSTSRRQGGAAADAPKRVLSDVRRSEVSRPNDPLGPANVGGVSIRPLAAYRVRWYPIVPPIACSGAPNATPNSGR